MTLFLGVDGGQSSTRAVIGDESGRILATGEGGPVEHVGAPQGRERVFRALQESAGGACRQLGRDLTDTPFEAAFFGFTGADAGKRAIVEELIHARQIGLSDDSVIALTGALGGEPGIVTIAGTGSISFGRNEAGETARAGGWGYLFGDEGSAFDLARQALRAALRFEEGWGPSTVLRRMLCEAVGLDDIRLVQRKLYSAEFTRKRIAALAPLVEEAARLQDPVACSILENAARDLAAITDVVRARLFQRKESATIAYVGGVFRCAMLRSEFIGLVSSSGTNRVIAPRHDPAVGALIEAYRLAGARVLVSQ